VDANLAGELVEGLPEKVTGMEPTSSLGALGYHLSGKLIYGNAPPPVAVTAAKPAGRLLTPVVAATAERQTVSLEVRRKTEVLTPLRLLRDNGGRHINGGLLGYSRR